MTKNTPIMVKAWLSALLCSVAWVSVAYAAPSDLEMAVAIVSDRAVAPQKTAGCLIVWSTVYSTTPIKSYCRYELGKNPFLRDNDVGFRKATQNQKKLQQSANQKKFQSNIQTWFGKQYSDQKIAQNDLPRIVEAMSRSPDEFSLFGPKPHHLVLPFSSDTSTDEKFADTVHQFLLNEKIPEKAAADQTDNAVSAEEAVAAQIKAAVEKLKPALMDEAKKADQEATKQTDSHLIPELWLVVPLVVVFVLIFVLLLWLMVKNKKLETRLSEKLSEIDNNIAQLKKSGQPNEAIEALKTRLPQLEENVRQLNTSLSAIQNQQQSEKTDKERLLKQVARLDQEKSQSEQALNSQKEFLKKAISAITSKFHLPSKSEMADSGKSMQTQLKVVIEQAVEKHESEKQSVQNQWQAVINGVIKECSLPGEESAKLTEATPEILAESVGRAIQHHVDETKVSLAKQLQTVISTVIEKSSLETGTQETADHLEATLEQLNQVIDEASTKHDLDRLTLETTVQEFLSERFLLNKPAEPAQFLPWITTLQEQLGVWRWLQPALIGEWLVCQSIVDGLKQNGNDNDRQIAELLDLNNIMKHWADLVGQTFSSDPALWTYLRDKDGGNWLNQLLRADDILQSYFPTAKNFKRLSQHLSLVNQSLLSAAFNEMEITLLKPKILQDVPSYVPKIRNTNYIYQTPELLKMLVKPLILKMIRDGKSNFVVDIERYGFVTSDNPKAANDVRVFVCNPSEWEE